MNPGLGRMRLRILLMGLVSIALLAPVPRPDRTLAPVSPHPARRRAADLVAAPGLPARPLSGSCSRLAPWRHRLKSVLELKEAWGDQPIDQGPAPISEGHDRPAEIVRSLSISPPLIVRRC